MRFDVALFQLRLFKSRTQAGEAIERGTARLNGQPVKPSRELRVGDRVTLDFTGGRRELEILELPHGSLSKDAARNHVREIPAQ